LGYLSSSKYTNWDKIAIVVKAIKNWRQLTALIIIGVVEIMMLLFCLRPELAIYIVIVIIALISLAYYIVKQETKVRAQNAYRKGISATYKSLLSELKIESKQALDDQEHQYIEKLYAKISYRLQSYKEESEELKQI
jgi:MFS superfamily sulfate permease-like transporter